MLSDLISTTLGDYESSCPGIGRRKLCYARNFYAYNNLCDDNSMCRECVMHVQVWVCGPLFLWHKMLPALDTVLYGITLNIALYCTFFLVTSHF